MSARRVLKRYLLICVSTAALLSVADAEKIDKAEFVGAIARTMPLTHIDVPVQLTGEITVVQTSGKKVSGTYALMIRSPQQWREEVSFANYQEVHVAIGDKLYIIRSAPVPDSAIVRAFRAMHEASYSRPSVEAKVTVREQKLRETKLRCAEITEPGKVYANTSEVCLYPDGTVARSSVSGASHLFFDYAPVGTRFVPQHILIKKDDESTADVQISKVTINPAMKEEWFAAPANAKEFGTCEVLTKSEQLNNQVPPHYPPQARIAGVQGSVVFYALVAADGKITELRTLRSPTKALELASVEAIRQWKYAPPMCGTTPISFETLITVNYSLRP